MALVFAVVGAAAPVLRIKKPLRSYRMVTRVGRSPLSRQAVLVWLFLLVLVVHWALMLAAIYALWLGILAVVIGTAAVLASGLTYLLGSQPAWPHWSTLLALFAGLLALGVSTSLVIALGWRDVLGSGTAASVAPRDLVLVGVAGLGGAAWGWTRYLKKVEQFDPYDCSILINSDTARRKGLKDGAEVNIEAFWGGKTRGTLKVTELIHPEALGFPGHHGFKGRLHNPITWKGPDFNDLLSDREGEFDPISCATDITPRVRIAEVGNTGQGGAR